MKTEEENNEEATQEASWKRWDLRTEDGIDPTTQREENIVQSKCSILYEGILLGPWDTMAEKSLWTL